MQSAISDAVNSATPRPMSSLRLHQYTGAHQHTNPWGWEGETSHYGYDENKTLRGGGCQKDNQ
uniref:Uncharacterized protein n=1 Tax=Romanomermis culicivorax TaxID=13658 RepID=A0A915L5I3_ROMCU